MPSITQSWYSQPLARTGLRERLTQDDINKDSPEKIYSIRGEAPEGYYMAGMEDGGAGYQDHQVFKKLPEAKAPETNNEPVEKKESNKNKNKKNDKSKAQVSVAPSQEVTEAKQRIKAYDPNSFGAYGPKKSAFAERSAEVYNPNQSFQPNQQSSVSADGEQKAQTFMQGKVNKTKNQFNFQPTLK